MRIHGDTLTRLDVERAATAAEVGFDVLVPHRSRARHHAFEVKLTGSGRKGDSGQHGASDTHTATWDEWGIFLSHLFAADDSLTIPKVYDDAEDFHERTGDRYDGREFTECSQHRFEGDGYSLGGQVCKKGCGAVRYWR